MKHFKSHKPGVTFIEIMLTIFMMGMILSSAFIAQSNALAHIGKWSRSLRLTLALRELFIHTAQDRMLGKMHPAEEKKGNVIITYNTFLPQKDSSLSKLEDLTVEKGRAVWAQEEETMISLLYKPAEEKKKK